MKGHVYAKGESTIKPVRHIRQVFEYFKARSNPRRHDEKLIFSVGEGECHLVFTCQATVGSHYYFALTFKRCAVAIGGEWSEGEQAFFWITHKSIWDQIQNISADYEQEIGLSIPEGFHYLAEGSWTFEGPWDEGVALLQSHGFVWCAEMEEKLCDEPHEEEIKGP